VSTPRRSGGLGRPGGDRGHRVRRLCAAPRAQKGTRLGSRPIFLKKLRSGTQLMNAAQSTMCHSPVNHVPQPSQPCATAQSTMCHSPVNHVPQPSQPCATAQPTMCHSRQASEQFGHRAAILGDDGNKASDRIGPVGVDVDAEMLERGRSQVFGTHGTSGDLAAVAISCADDLPVP